MKFVKQKVCIRERVDFSENLLKESRRYNEKEGDSVSIGTKITDSEISGGPRFLREISRRWKGKKHRRKCL